MSLTDTATRSRVSMSGAQDPTPRRIGLDGDFMLPEQAPNPSSLPDLLIGAIVSLFLLLVAIVRWIQGKYAKEVEGLRGELDEARHELRKATDEKIEDRERIARLEAICEVQKQDRK